MSLNLDQLVNTTIFNCAAQDLLIDVRDNSKPQFNAADLPPESAAAPVLVDLNPHIASITSDSSGELQNVDSEEALRRVAAAGAGMSVTKVCVRLYVAVYVAVTLLCLILGLECANW
jgi:hypothetical protein